MRPFRVALAGVVCAFFAAGSAFAQSLLRDEEIERMLHTFADPIFEAAGLPSEDVNIYIVGDRTMNAGAFAGLNMVVNTGLIVNAQEPIEIKGVLAHETGHIIGAHISRSGEMSRAAMGPFLATMAAGIAAAVAGHGDAAAGLLMSSEYFGTLGALTYSRGQEHRADLAGVELLEASGQSARGMIAFFERFREQELFSEQRRYPYFRSHPISSERISILRERLAQQEHRDALDPLEHVVMLDRAKAKIYGFMDSPQTTFRRFPEDQQHTEAIYARSIAHYKAGSLDLAIQGIDELIRREPGNPYFWELKGQVYYEYGRPALAIEPYERAVELLPDAALFRIGLAQALLGVEDDAKLDEALEHLVVALAIEPDNALAWRERSQVHARRGEQAMATYSIAEQSYYAGDPLRAAQFASRAREDLDRGSPEWLRASDIVASFEAIREDYEAEMRRRRN